MKKILACMVVMAFATIAVEADAQSLLKKIGKAVEKEIVNELKSKNEEKKQSPQQAKPQQPATANTPTQSNATQKQSYASADPSSINVPISEVYPNAQFYNEGVTGATTIIDGIEYVILADKKYAYLNCVEKSNRGKTSNVKVWGGIRYKGVVYPVMYIGPHAFEGESLTSVQLPSTLQEIREEAFCHSMLKSVVMAHRQISFCRHSARERSHIEWCKENRGRRLCRLYKSDTSDDSRVGDKPRQEHL